MDKAKLEKLAEIMRWSVFHHPQEAKKPEWHQKEFQSNVHRGRILPKGDFVNEHGSRFTSTGVHWSESDPAAIADAASYDEQARLWEEQDPYHFTDEPQWESAYLEERSVHATSGKSGQEG